MKKEIWKDIEGFEGLYQISTYGRVKSLGRYVERIRCGKSEKSGKLWINEKIMSPVTCGAGYLSVALCKNNKTTHKMIHRLVAIAFIPNPNNLSQVNHKDENKTNNHIDNLEWCTDLYNKHYGTGRQRQAESLKGVYINSKNPNAHAVICEGIVYPSIKECAEHYGIKPNTLYDVLSRTNRPHKKWENYGLAYV